MAREYAALQVRPVRPGVLLCKPEQPAAPRVALEDPAARVFTDFRSTPVALADTQCTVEQASELMKFRGVRLLFLVTPAGEVAGLVTATDVLSEKPTRVVRERGIRHSEVLASDIMTPAVRFEAIDYDEVLRARVGQMVETLKRLGRQHLMVVESDAQGAQTIRGLFSLSQIARQLGVPLQATEIASSFAEIESALA